MTKVKIDNELTARAKVAFDSRSKILSNQSLSRIELRALERTGRVKSVIRKSSDGSIRRIYMRPATFEDMKKQWGKEKEMEKVIKKMPAKEKTAIKKRLIINIFKRIWLFIKKFIVG